MRITKTIWIRDLSDGDEVQIPVLVKRSELEQGKTGKAYLSLILMDQTGEVDGRVWDSVADMANILVRDALVNVRAKVQVYQGRKQVVVKGAELLREDQVDLGWFLPKSKVDFEKEWSALKSYIQSMECPFYRGLCEAVFLENEEVRKRLKKAPAAKSMHHAYEAGLIEHIVSVLGILDRISQHYGKKVDRDLLLLGGFFHDIGKIWELSYERTTDYTTEGRLLGHLVMGIELIERTIQMLDSMPGRLPAPFPIEKKLLAKHMVVAHHGKLEYGSPKEPQVLEALIVHMVDDLDSKVNAIYEFLATDPTAGEWSSLHKQFGRYFYKGLLS
jgi:3'-5' exoribonuclease